MESFADEHNQDVRVDKNGYYQLQKRIFMRGDLHVSWKGVIFRLDNATLQVEVQYFRRPRQLDRINRPPNVPKCCAI
jgi:hypothetical protein